MQPQMIPVDIMLNSLGSIINNLYTHINDDPNSFVLTVEEVVLKAFITATNAGLIDRNAEVWTVDIGFYRDNQSEVIKTADDLLYKVNKILDVYNYQTTSTVVSPNPMMLESKRVLLEILQCQKVLPTSTVTFSVLNLVNHAERVVV